MNRRVGTRTHGGVEAEARKGLGYPMSGRIPRATCTTGLPRIWPVVQAALGHKRLSSTRVYAHVTPGQVAAGVERLAGG